MDPDKQQEVFDDKYSAKLGLSYQDWVETAPANEEEAYAFCQQLDDELKNTYEEWFNAEGDEREELTDYRAKLKLEYDMIEELFGLELNDR
ncbi:MAG TPA: hypothetical protein VHQ41_03445 [Patescibacteria group bacterium]|jgi:hypothetical protein|nr:hypothetical protein [Patescibacteria group bacterium]